MSAQPDELALGNLYERADDGGWADIESEGERLVGMDRWLADLTRSELQPHLVAANKQSGGQAFDVVDIGAGPGLTVEQLTEEAGGRYWAVDVNAKLLDRRPTDPDRKILAEKDEPIPLGTNMADVTYSRALGAWNVRRPGAAEALISEQLRLTRPGGVAVFSEFDWTQVGPGEDTPHARTIESIRTIILFTLSRGGFEPSYGGGRLGELVRGVAATHLRSYEIVETPHAFAEGDHRQLFLDAIDTIIGQLRTSRRGNLFAGMLMNYREEIAGAEHISIHLPLLVTQTVRIHSKLK